jgi:uncharacterized protein (UPF0276 family)
VNRFDLPNLGVGLGLRTVHYAHILEHSPAIDWFEIISDNYMYTQGRPLLFLDRIAERYPIVMHGVSLSIGSTDPIDFDYLRELKALRRRTKASWVSDHLCWTGVAGRNSHDLLPLPYTEATLHHVVERIRIVQDYLETPLILENPSTYVEFASSTMREWEFLNALVERADCGLLLDVNNVYVSAHNHGYEPCEYLDAIAYDRVVQFHVAGHTHSDQHLIDSHIGPVAPPVWDLLQVAHARAPNASVLVEWDAEIPPFETLLQEAHRARQYLSQSRVEPPLAPHVEDAVA